MSARSYGIVVKDSYSRAEMTVLRDPGTSIEQGPGWPALGDQVMVTGLDLGHNTMRAFKVWVYNRSGY